MAELSGYLFDAIDPKTQHICFGSRKNNKITHFCSVLGCDFLKLNISNQTFTKLNAMGPPWVQVVVKRTSFGPARWAINLVTWENQPLKIDR